MALRQVQRGKRIPILRSSFGHGEFDAVEGIRPVRSIDEHRLVAQHAPERSGVSQDRQWLASIDGIGRQVPGVEGDGIGVDVAIWKYLIEHSRFAVVHIQRANGQVRPHFTLETERCRVEIRHLEVWIDNACYSTRRAEIVRRAHALQSSQERFRCHTR